MSFRSTIDDIFTAFKDKVNTSLKKATVTITVEDDNALKTVQQTLNKFGTKYTTVNKTVTIRFE